VRNLRDSYNISAPSYDLTRYEDHPSKSLYLRVANESFAANIPKTKPMRILDFATGTGRLSLRLAELDYQPVSVDISEEMIKLARQKADTSGQASIAWSIADGLALPFADNTFDCIVSSKFFHLVEYHYHPQFLNELFRVLKPHGTIIADFNNIIFWTFLKFVRGKSRKREYAYSPWQRYTVYKQWKIASIQGQWMPYSYQVFKVSEGLFSLYNRLSPMFPFKYLCSKLVIVFRKEGK